MTKLLLLPNPSFHDNLIDKVSSLTTTIVEVNGEFVDTKMLIRASIFNVYNEGVKKSSGDKDEDGNEAKSAEEKEKVRMHQTSELYSFTCDIHPTCPTAFIAGRYPEVLFHLARSEHHGPL